MKEKAVYKHGMHGDRNSMGNKAMSQKMNDYFPHNNIPAGDTNPNMQQNYLIQDASPVVTMGQYGTRQSKWIDKDGMAIDASRTQGMEMYEAGIKQNGGNKPYTTKTSSTTLDNDKTFSLSKSKGYTINEFGEKEYSSSGGGAGNVSDFTTSMETSGSSDIGEIPAGTYTRSKQKVPATTTYVNPRGKEMSAKTGTLKAKALETIYNIRTKQGRFRSTEKYSPEEKVYKFKGGKETITRT